MQTIIVTIKAKENQNQGFRYLNELAIYSEDSFFQRNVTCQRLSRGSILFSSNRGITKTEK